MDPGPRPGLVHFPLAGDLAHGIAAVRVIDWGQPAGTRLTLAGPGAHALGKDEEIEVTLRTERLCGGCRPAVPDGQLMVELVVADGQQISGKSYTLALVLAAQLARGGLPLLAGRCVIASGLVERDGALSPVGQLAQKLAAIGRALVEGSIAAPLLVLARGNLECMTLEEQGALRALTAFGLRCVGLANLADLGPAWPPELRPAPVPSPARARAWPRWGPAAAVLGLGLAGAALSLVQRAPDPCASLSADPAIITRCWGPLPLTLTAACRVERQGGYRPWRPCPSGTCLAGPDQFRLEPRPAAAGWLYVFHLDAADQVLVDLWPDAARRSVRAGETLVLPTAGQTYHLDGRAPQERFYALLTRRPLPGLTGPGGTAQPALRAVLEAVAEPFVVCLDPVAAGGR